MEHDIADRRGLVARAILRQSEARKNAAVVTRTRAELDLANQCALRCVKGAAGHEGQRLSSPRRWLAFMPTAPARKNLSIRP